MNVSSCICFLISTIFGSCDIFFYFLYIKHTIKRNYQEIEYNKLYIAVNIASANTKYNPDNITKTNIPIVKLIYCFFVGCFNPLTVSKLS